MLLSANVNSSENFKVIGKGKNIEFVWVFFPPLFTIGQAAFF